jgi:hypothetical protein
MPAKSKDQQRAAGIAYSAKCKGKKTTPKKGPSKQMAQSMSCKELKEFASTKRSKLKKKDKK